MVGSNSKASTFFQISRLLMVYAKKQSCVELRALVFILVYILFQHARAATIYVDERRGIANSTCCSGQDEPVACETLSLALECVKSLPLTTPVAIIVNEGAVYMLTNNSNLTVIAQRSGGFNITGNCSSVDCRVKIECEENAGLTFIQSEQILLENLVFSGCGHPNNSTSKDFSSGPPHFIVVKTTLYFLLCKAVTLSHTTVKNTVGTGVVMYSTMGTNTITESRFLGNKPVKYSFTGGGGLYIEFPFCYPGNTSCFSGTTNIPTQYTSGGNYIITNSEFSGNLANISDTSQFTFILPQKANHLAFGRGGGLSIFFKGNASNNSVIVDGCNFVNNTALWGSGVFIEHHDFSYNNSVLINNSFVEDNQCFYKASSSQGTGGGGARVGYIFFDGTHAKSNSITFQNCTIASNTAYFGGGVSFYAAREPAESSPTNTLVFVDTILKDNVARAGSGADLSVWHSVTRGATAVANFTNCSFSGNKGSYTDQQNTVVGIGALYLDSISVYFMAENWFEDNSHSALAAFNAGIYLTDNATLRFVNNTGHNGAGIALLGAAFLQTYPNSRAEFVNNSAYLRGGAIYQYSIGHRDLINSRNCFIRYSNISQTPHEWESSFYFSGNLADRHNESIHATSLLICQWGGAFGNSSLDLADVFCWPHIWNYSGNDCRDEVHTSPAHFEPTSDFQFDVIPGQRHILPLKMIDDRGSDVTNSSVLLAKSLSSGIQIDPSSKYISDNRIEILTGNISTVYNNSGEILLETIDPRVIRAKFNITVLSCPPGMMLRGNGRSSMCQCGGHFDGILQCNSTGFYTKLQRGNWIGIHTHNHEKEIVASSTPYFDLNSDDYITLPNSTEKLNSFLCHKIHRTGTLCGQCIEGYGPTIHTLDCVRCDARYMWVYYLLSQYLPLTVLFVLVIVMDIRVTSAAANAFVFFAQVLPTVFTLNGGGSILLKHADNYPTLVFTSVYDIWNLKFLQLKICLSPQLSSLWVIAITYLEAAYPLLLILLVSFMIWLYERGFRWMMCLLRPFHFLLARFQRRWNIQRSLIHTFASFILLAYSRFILVSFFLLTQTPLVKENGDAFGPDPVAFYDGTVPYFSRKHAPFVALALLFLVTFVAITPILLLVPSLSHNTSIIRNRWPRLARFIPNMEQLVAKCYKWTKLNLFLEAFHGCFKDGTNSTSLSPDFDYRWCAAFYLLLRVVIIAVYAFTPEWFIQYSFLQFLCIAAILVFALFRPYKNDFYNKLDASMFCLLVAINTLTMYNYYKTAIGYQPSVLILILQNVMVMLPLVYMSIVIARYLHRCVCACCKSQIHTVEEDEWEGLVENRGYDEQVGPNDYLTFMDQTGRLDDVNMYRPASSATNSSGSDEGQSQVFNEGHYTTDAHRSNKSSHHPSTDRGFSSGASNDACTNSYKEGEAEKPRSEERSSSMTKTTDCHQSTECLNSREKRQRQSYGSLKGT